MGGRTLDPNSQYSFDGQPVVGGKAYYGVANQDPKLNPVPIYSDAAFAVEIDNPQDTDQQGRVINKVYINVDEYSYTVDDAGDNQLLTEPALNPLSVAGAVTEDVDMDGFKFTNVGEATANDQYLTYGQNAKLDRQALPATGSPAAVDAIEANWPIPPDSLDDLQQVVVRTNTGPNTGLFTLKMNTFAPQPCVKENGDPVIAGDLPGAGYNAEFIFNVSFGAFVLQNPFKVDGTHIIGESVTQQAIGPGAVEEDKIQADAVTRTKILDGEVIESKLATDSVTRTKILDGEVIESKLAVDSVSQGKMQDDSVGTNEIINDNVTTPKIADLNVATPKIQDGTNTGATDAGGGGVTRAKMAKMSSTGNYPAATANVGVGGMDLLYTWGEGFTEFAEIVIPIASILDDYDALELHMDGWGILSPDFGHYAMSSDGGVTYPWDISIGQPNWIDSAVFKFTGMTVSYLNAPGFKPSVVIAGLHSGNTGWSRYDGGSETPLPLRPTHIKFYNSTPTIYIRTMRLFGFINPTT